MNEFALLRAAEEARKTGYCCFLLTAQEDISRTTTQTFTTPTETTVNATANTYGNTTYVNGTATTTGGVESYSYYFPGKVAGFVMFDAPPEGYRPGQYFDAVTVYNDLGPKYIKGFVPLVSIKLQPAPDQANTEDVTTD